MVGAYDVKAMPEDQKWDKEAVKNMIGTTGTPNPNTAEIHILIRVHVDDGHGE